MGVDEIICANTPEPFLGVGQFYFDFSQTTDDEVRQIMSEAGDLKSSESKDCELLHG